MNTRILVPALALGLAATAVSSCGFRPLYGSQGVRNGSVKADLSSVAISQISNRAGQILRNRLVDKMTPTGQPATPAYRLSVRLTESKVPLGIRKDETATRANMNQTALYMLQETATNVVVDRGSVQSTTSYNIVDSDFGTIMAERDARKRGLEQIAETITLRVALYFNRKGTLTGKPATPAARTVQKK
jgi:LPS-assembly lipoprotein